MTEAHSTKKIPSLVLLEVRDLVNKSPQMSASGSDLATDGPVCPHFGSDCWANLSTCVRIRIGHRRFFDPIYVRIGIEPLTAYSRVLVGRGRKPATRVTGRISLRTSAMLSLAMLSLGQCTKHDYLQRAM